MTTTAIDYALVDHINSLIAGVIESTPHTLDRIILCEDKLRGIMISRETFNKLTLPNVGLNWEKLFEYNIRSSQ